MKNNIIDVKRTESSPTEPCTLTEAKAQGIITYTDDDALITSLITKARKMIENYCNISIVAQTVTMVADLWNEYELPYGPVTGIQSVQTRTSTEGSGPASYATLTSGWAQDGDEFMTFIPSNTGDFNPSIPFTGNLNPPKNNRFKIQYTAGYSTVPDDLKQAVLLQVVWLYEHRGEEGKPGLCQEALGIADKYWRALWQ